ncbi:endo-1,4-beta-xylanase [Akkermansiaceae bacterium]|nr:endo-1,4-beta-xylanase [Akkermansiaceae bacterium]
MKLIPTVTALLLVATRLGALELPAGGFDMSASAKLTAYADGKVGTVGKLTPAGFRVSITHPDPANSFRAQVSIACPQGALAKGDKVLAVVTARVAGGETGSLEAKLQLAGAPYTQASNPTNISLSPAWADYPLLFVVENPIPEGKSSMNLFCANAAQVIEVSAIRVLRYAPETDVSRFPRVRRSYAGREADAPWRKAALERIEKIRKADCSLVLTDPTGKPLANTSVDLTLRRHEFGFGSAIPASLLVANTRDGERFREVVDRLFSIVVFENDLKDMWWGGSTPAHERAARNAELDKAFDWLGERRIAVRGHYLMQTAVPHNLSGMESPAIRSHFLETTRRRIGFAGDRVCEWDAINHPIAWTGAELLSTRPGLEKIDLEVLALARSLTLVPMFVNEDQLFRPGPQSDGTWAYLKELKDAGIRIDGLGNQAHLHESYLPSPEHVLAVTDRFAEVVQAQSITEFDIKTVDDEELAADYTRDLLIACFSHPAYTSFLLWGFWEGSHWEPTAASWKKDWSILKRGEVLEEWLGKRWRTEVTLTTDAAGRVQWRGFPGTYEIKLTADTRASARFSVGMSKPEGNATLPSP